MKLTDQQVALLGPQTRLILSSPGARLVSAGGAAPFLPFGAAPLTLRNSAK